MVFESFVVEMVNRYLGTFVEDLDKSQLSIGLWSANQDIHIDDSEKGSSSTQGSQHYYTAFPGGEPGDVVLTNLNLKESALESLNIPVKIMAGHLGKLTLKIPWKKLYTEAVLVHIDGIYALAVPNIAIKYDPKLDRQVKQKEKLARLANIEKQKQWKINKGMGKDEKENTFIEKFATQVIKNLQIKVSNVHIRYEDKYTNSKYPISFGLTLQELLFQTTDSAWKETVVKEAVSQIYKLVRLDSLSIYLNSNSELMQNRSNKQILRALSENLPKHGSKSKFQFLFQPISAVAHIRLNIKPEIMDFALPKIQVTLVIDEITMTMTKSQYNDVLEMLEAFERVNLMNKYKETRPDVPYKDNAKQWWLHAYAVVLKYSIRRKRNMWRWVNLKKHRESLKIYRELYAQKLSGKILGRKELKLIEEIEEELDVINICIGRNQAEWDVARMEKNREEKNKLVLWFDKWVNPEKQDEENQNPDIEVTPSHSIHIDSKAKFQQEFTEEEKNKLYNAIGYNANANDPNFPVEFVSVRVIVKLNKLSLELLGEDKAKDTHLLKLILTETCASFGERPAANAIRVDVKVEQLRAVGSPRADYTPKLINSVGISKNADISLLNVSFETNPLDGTCDTRIRAESRSLEIIYDAVTVNTLVTFFRPPESVKLRQLTNAAMARYDSIVSQTTAGVVFMMSERKYTDIEVHLMPSYVIIPEAGELKRDVKMLLLNMGSLNVTSEKNREMPMGAQLSPNEFASYAYDKFNISIDNVQLLFVQPGDTWKDESNSTNSPLYILRPMSIQLLLEKCLFARDSNLPQFQLSGELPLVAVTLSDVKLVAILNLIQSIPLPEQAPGVKEDEDEFDEAHKITNLDFTRLSKGKVQTTLTSDFTNLTQLSIAFIIMEVSLELRETICQKESPFLQFIMTRIGATMKARTYDVSVELFLGGIYLKHLQFKISEDIRSQLNKCHVITGPNVNIINSPFEDINEPLLVIHFIQAYKKGPEFKTTYSGIAQSITVEFSTLDIILHQGVILSLLQFAKKLELSLAISPETVSSVVQKSSVSLVSIISSHSIPFLDKPKISPDLLTLKVKALVDNIEFGICNAKCVIMHSKVEGIEVGVSLQNKTLDLTTVMRKVEVIDPDPRTYHPVIFTVEGTDMLKLELTHFLKTPGKKSNEDIYDLDAILLLKMGRAHIKFVNKFFMSIAYFFDNFIVAKAKLDNARQAVKDVSLDVAKTLQAKVPLVKLDIMIKAPSIVVPQNSKSRNVLIIQLGDITVQNKFSKGALKAYKTTPIMWVVDNMIVKLTNLGISRGIAKHHLNASAPEVTILEPLTFIIEVFRNLSCANYTEIPDVKVKGMLEQIDIKMSQEDVRLITLIATENADERYADGPQKAKAKLVIVRVQPQTTVQRVSTSVGKIKLAEPNRELHCQFKLDFQLQAINIELFRGTVNLLHLKTAKSPDKLLTYFTLKFMKLEFSLQSDNSMSAIIFLHDVSMDDCRTEKAGGITKIIRRTAFKTATRAALKAREKEDKENMVVHVVFEQSRTKDMTINIQSCSLHICLCAEFLMKVAEFFTKAMTVKQSDIPPKAPKEVQAFVSQKENLATLKAAPEMEGVIDLNFVLQKPEIYIIEDQMNPHTDSIIINMEMTFHLTMSATDLAVYGGIKKLSLIICTFEKEDKIRKSYLKYFKWSQDKVRVISSVEKELLEICYNYYEDKWEMLPTLNYILVPLDIVINGYGPQSRDHHVDVNITNCTMTITPTVVHFLTAVVNSIYPDPEMDEPERKGSDFSGIWDTQDLENCNYWFTQSVLDTDITIPEEMATKIDLTGAQPLNEMQTITILYIKEKFVKRNVHYYENQIKELLPKFLNVITKAPSMVLKLESGHGHKTVPLLIVESSFTSQIHNWTSNMYFKCTLGVEIAYNNLNIGIWEPILEPVMDAKTSTFRKWTFTAEVMKNLDSDMNLKEEYFATPETVINIVAHEPLQLVMSKACLNIVHQLEDAYTKAYQFTLNEGTIGQQVYPYQFRNKLGIDMVLIPDNSFEPLTDSIPEDLKEFKSNKDIFMNVKITEIKDKSIIRSTKPEERKISFKIVKCDILKDVHIKQVKKQVFQFDKYQVVISIDAFIEHKMISFTSLLQVMNHLNVPIEIKYKSTAGILSAGVVFPSETFPVPLEVVSNSSGPIFFQPKTEDSSEGIEWQSLTDKSDVVQIICESIIREKPPYYFSVLPKFEKVYTENTNERKEQLVTLDLCPSVILHNLLPFSLLLNIRGTEENHVLESGHYYPLSHASVDKSVFQVKISNYRKLTWTAQIYTDLTKSEITVLTFEADDSGISIFMDLGLHCKQKQGSLNITVYSPYWIVNLAAADIALKEEDNGIPFVHKKDDKDVMLFYFMFKPVSEDVVKGKVTDEGCKGCKNCAQKKCFKQKNRVSLQIDNSDWSKKFSLDTAGSNGNILCPKISEKRTFEVGVKIKLASSGLTKIVTFTPFFLLINASSLHLCVREHQQLTWITLNPGEYSGWYPISDTKDKKIVAKILDEDAETVPFFLNKAHVTLLRLNSNIGGINAECQVSESAMITTLKTYVPGMATVLFVNNIESATVSIKQVGSADYNVVLKPQTSELYTWTDPTAKREIIWTCAGRKNTKTKLDRDKLEEFRIMGKVKTYFVSFLNGLQRVVMFTGDQSLAKLAIEAGEIEKADYEINIKICDLGFSLVDNEKRKEVAYLGITSTGVIWEEFKKKRYKTLKPKDAENMENIYQKYLLKVAETGWSDSMFQLENRHEVDFGTMEKVKPYKSTIRRRIEDGIWLQFRESAHSLQFHSKINRLQFDSQLRNCTFPTILSPMPITRTFTSDGIKPFIEISLTMRIHKHSNLLQIKYFKVLIQEMNVMIDQSFINGVLSLFETDMQTSLDNELNMFNYDLARSKRLLKVEADAFIQAKRVSFFDHFHISPIKIHLSFSLQGISVSETHQVNVLNVFLQSVGVVLTDVNDVVFKLGYFERNYAFFNDAKLTKEFIKHYTGQAIKQMYVLVLGLDVLGNPFGLLRGLTEGIEDLFYEPYQGAIQGPQEFAIGLALGIRSLFAHVVGDTASALSKIVRTLGEGLVALTLDEDYKKKRLEMNKKRPKSCHAGLAQGGKEMVMGLYDGVTGVVIKPIKGVMQEGAIGLFKGVGKGLIGIVIKPVSGVMAFASRSLDGIHRMTDFSGEIFHLRPPRPFMQNGTIYPFVLEQAEGYNFMLDTDNEKYFETDEYVTHVKIKEDGKIVFIVTDMRVMLVKHGEIFGQLKAEWMFTYNELESYPTTTDYGIQICYKYDEKKKLLKGGSKLEVVIDNSEISQAIAANIKEIMKTKHGIYFGRQQMNNAA